MSNKDSTQLEKLEENFPYICTECGEFSSQKHLFCEKCNGKNTIRKSIRNDYINYISKSSEIYSDNQAISSENQLSKSISIKLKLLTLLFTFVLVFLTFEIPNQINNVLIQIYPDFDPTGHLQEVNQILNGFRPIGYLSLLIIIILIILGALIKSEKITVTGSILLFLPTFGGFAMAMLFFAGIGILQVFWLPLNTPFFNFLPLGFLFEVPIYLLASFGPYFFYIIIVIPWLFMFIGLYIFTTSVISWMYGKYQKKDVIDFMMYKHSRHPQYLGFLIWSYGLFILYVMFDQFLTAFGRISTYASLPWLISSLIIIYIAFSEDIKLSKKYPDKYSEYRKKTPFLLKLPSSKLNAFI
ncbi:MAG: hypothetical protein P8Y97_23165, partial [Candidatus Lokiarchaeota archaeon]